MKEPSAPTAPMASWTATFFTRLHRYKTLLKRRWYILLFCSAAGAAYQAYMLTGVPPTYSSGGQLIVSAQVNLPESSMVRESSNTFYGDQLDLMRSSEVTRRAHARVAATHPQMIRSGVRLDARQKTFTSIFLLSASGSEPEYTQAFLDAVMDEYINLRRESRSETSQDAVSMMTEQMVRLERDVKKGEEDLQQFLTTNNVLFLEEQSQAAVDRLQDLRKEQAYLESEYRLLGMVTVEQNIQRTTSQAEGGTPDGNDSSSRPNTLGADPNRDYQESLNAIRKLEIEQAELAEHLKPAHPKMIRLKDEIARQQRLIESFKIESLQGMKAQRETLKLRLENLSQTIATEEKNALELSQRMGEYSRLKGRLDRYQSMHDRMFETIQKVDLSSNMDQEQVSIYQRATPSQISSVNVYAGIIQGAGIGLLIGIGILFLLDRVDDRINSLTELRDHLDETVLGQIPMDSESAKSQSMKLILENDKRHQFVESYRNVRSSLRFMAMEGERPSSLLVTSAIPGEGKTTFTANLAITMAFAGSRVLLVDADMRRGRQHKLFGAPNEPGLSDSLTGDTSWRDAVFQTNYPNLSMIPCGATPPNPGELLLTEYCDSILAEWTAEYDQVIIDSAPILATDDSASLAPKLDGTIFLVRTSYTSARLVHSALDALYQRQVNIQGLVLNCVNTELPEYYYYQYRDYYSRTS